MPRIMTKLKVKDNGGPIQRVGLVYASVREGTYRQRFPEKVQGVASEGGEVADPAYNRSDDGEELLYPGKVSGRRKLRDEDVVRLRRNEEQLSYNHWAKIYKVTPAVIWNAMKGLTYKHLNWNHPPIR